ncbi:EAP30/Vps36 family-domain-containing protein [Tuber borchii]|uniref:Vacuolar protein-sorting-associated protein 36 n=1 Tax=Tuber borchii TaxID=42251 RepID=A0A2T6ZIB9_TUBBO|nr:EAP30/Vps36 family-domain-containing protein [Tuber borchii]
MWGNGSYNRPRNLEAGTLEMGGHDFDGAVLFCYGDLGVGKTYISSLVIDNLCDQARGQNAAVACFYFVAAQREQSSTSMLGALLNRLKLVIGGKGPQLSDIVKMLRTTSSEKRTFICIDALDECAAEYRVKVLNSLNQILHSSPGTRMFVAGRPYFKREIEKHSSGRVTALRITARRGDIITYLQSRLDEDTTPDAIESSLEADILKKIPEEISEIFLLVSLNIDAILQETTIYQRRQKLSAMTDGLGLGDAYGVTLGRIKGKKWEENEAWDGGFESLTRSGPGTGGKGGGPQEGINSLSKTDEFADILHEQVIKRGLSRPDVKVVKFSFCAGGDKVFPEWLKNALIERKWLLYNAPPVATPGQSGNGGASSVGIVGLKGAAMNGRKEAVIGGAFENLEALMGCAKEIVALAEEFSTHLSSTPTFANSEAKAALRNSTQELGIVTKDMLTAATGGSNSSSSDKASDLYLFEHARQVAEFLTNNARGIHRRGILRREGGVIALVDLLAIYDKKAIGLFEKLKLPVRVPRFWSGLLVVQEARSSDAEIVRRIMECVAGPGWGRGVTTAQAAERFGWSIGVAAEELGMVEDRGALCCEVGVEGVRFWKN